MILGVLSVVQFSSLGNQGGGLKFNSDVIKFSHGCNDLGAFWVSGFPCRHVF